VKQRKPLLALCPIGKFVFSNVDAIRYKCLIQQKLTEWEIPFVDLDGVLEDGLIKDQTHIEAAVAHFQQTGAEGLFVPHCNFGTEGAVGMIAKKLGLPTLLWGPRDEAPLPDGTRLRDTLCGLFASSKVLYKLGVPFSYIENCHIDEKPLEEGMDTFLRAVNVANAFRKGIRIGMIGQRIDFFWTTIVNESELLQRFNVEVLPIDMVDFIKAAKELANRDRDLYLAEITEISNKINVQGLGEEEFLNVLAVRDHILYLAAAQKLDGIAFQTFMSVIDAMGAYCIFAESAVTEQLPFALETDIHGAISAILMHRANLGVDPVFLAEFTIRHPENDNAVLLWHAGAPISMAHPDEKVEMGYHWILPSPLSGMLHFRLKDGPITVARFDGDFGEYNLAFGEGKSIDGPKTLNNYLWMEVNNWPKWERTLIEGPFIHHCAIGYGNFANVLMEACKYIPGPILTRRWKWVITGFCPAPSLECFTSV
jgi:L-fucose isomerase-like protein